jgi:hypothetical protein
VIDNAPASTRRADEIYKGESSSDRRRIGVGRERAKGQSSECAPRFYPLNVLISQCDLLNGSLLRTLRRKLSHPDG